MNKVIFAALVLSFSVTAYAQQTGTQSSLINLGR